MVNLQQTQKQLQAQLASGALSPEQAQAAMAQHAETILGGCGCGLGGWDGSVGDGMGRAMP